MRKRAVALLIAFLLLVLGARLTDTQALSDTAEYRTQARGAVILDAATGRILFTQNGEERLPMASTTKIMTALLTLEQEHLDDCFLVDASAIHVEGSSMGLREGDSVSLRTLAYGMLLPSGNDAANAAAVKIAGSIAAFVERMNSRAAELGLENTHFATPSGLDANEHYSSAHDLAVLAREALENPDFADICKKTGARVEYGNPPYPRWLSNHNRLLKEYPGAIGVKTGFTDAAGRCLVSAAERDGVRLIAVTLHCPDDWNEHSKLYDHYFELLTPVKTGGLMSSAQIRVVGGAADSVEARPAQEETLALLPGETLEAKVSAAKFLYAPVKKGQIVGSMQFCCNGAVLEETPLVATADVATQTPKPSFFRRFL